MRRRLKERGLHHRIPAEKEKLTVRHRNLRLRFAETYVNKNLDFGAQLFSRTEKHFLPQHMVNFTVIDEVAPDTLVRTFAKSPEVAM